MMIDIFLFQNLLAKEYSPHNIFWANLPLWGLFPANHAILLAHTAVEVALNGLKIYHYESNIQSPGHLEKCHSKGLHYQHMR